MKVNLRVLTTLFVECYLSRAYGLYNNYASLHTHSGKTELVMKII